jgi:hypothetical protein
VITSDSSSGLNGKVAAGVGDDPCAVFMHPSIMIRACCAAQGVVVGRGAQEVKNAFLKTIILYRPKVGFAHPGVYSKAWTATGTTGKAEEWLFCCVHSWGRGAGCCARECFFWAAFVGCFFQKVFHRLVDHGRWTAVPR